MKFHAINWKLCKLASLISPSEPISSKTFDPILACVNMRNNPKVWVKSHVFGITHVTCNVICSDRSACEIECQTIGLVTVELLMGPISHFPVFIEGTWPGPIMYGKGCELGMVTAYTGLYKGALSFTVKQLARVKVFNFSSIKRVVWYIRKIDT